MARHTHGGTFMAKAALLLSLALPCASALAADKSETAFERVMRTNTLRCGYYVYPPATYRDPNTDALSGMAVDIMEEIGRRGGLKIEWTQETGFADWIPSIQQGRFDAACTFNWPDIPQARAVAYSIPLFYAGLYPLVRADDARFGDDIEALNDEKITFAAPEGNAIVSLTQARFPKAKIHTQPPGTDTSLYAMEVLTKKADAFLGDMNNLYQFNKNNPAKLRMMAAQGPVKLQPMNLAVARQEMVLKDWLDNAILDLVNDGTMDRLLRKWEEEPGKTFLRAAPAYKAAP